MSNQFNEDRPVNFKLWKLYPKLTEAELQEVEDTLDRYLAVALMVHDRLKAEAKERAELKRRRRKKKS